MLPQLCAVLREAGPGELRPGLGPSRGLTSSSAIASGYWRRPKHSL